MKTLFRARERGAGWSALLFALLCCVGGASAQPAPGMSGATVTLAPGESKKIPHTLGLPLSRLRIGVIENGRSLSEQEVDHVLKFTQERGASDAFAVTNISSSPRTVTIAASPHATVDRAGSRFR